MFQVTSRIWNVTHSGVTGNITFDENGDRQVDFVLLDLDPEDNVYKVKIKLLQNSAFQHTLAEEPHLPLFVC